MLDDGPLAIALNDWDPPQDLTGSSAEVAERLDQVLESALALPEQAEEVPELRGASISVEGEESLLEALLTRTGALSGLADALEGVSLDGFTLKIGEDLTVDAGEVLEGDLILVDGELDVRGTIDGDVILAVGAVRLWEEGSITGDLRLADGELERSDGTVEGSILIAAEADRIVLDEEGLERMRRDLESEIRRDLRSTMDTGARRSSNIFLGFLGNVGSAIAELLETLIAFLVLAILGVLAVHFQKERLEVVATTAYRAPVRSAVVGLAGGFFILPIWIVGTIALAITIIGIPVLLAWVPLFPIAAALAMLLGYLGVARNVGEWVADQEYRGLEWIRGSNTFYTVVAGVAALMLPALAVGLSKILGFGILTGLLELVNSLVAFAAVSVGFGAVLLTRGGRIRPLESYYDFEEDYWADMDPREADTASPDSAAESSPHHEGHHDPGEAPAEAEEGPEGGSDDDGAPEVEESPEEHPADLGEDEGEKEGEHA
jgi:hypothetical protein